MTAKERFLSSATWQYVAQFLVGFFFLAAAYHKVVQGFFGPDRVPLSAIFQHWIRNSLPLEVYRDGWRAPPTNGYHANGANGPNGRRPLPMEVDASSYVRASTPILEGFDEEDFP
jgi:hypothetical protein